MINWLSAMWLCSDELIPLRHASPTPQVLYCDKHHQSMSASMQKGRRGTENAPNLDRKGK